MDNCCCVELKVTEDPIIALDIKEQFISGGEITPTGTKEISVTQNGTTTTDVTYYANAKVVANVPNTYAAADEGKVVQDGDLESQTTATFEANDVYDTTTIKQVTVDVPASAVDSGYVYINENDTVDVVGYAQAVVNVPNTYTASDEGKVVDDGELVAQGSATYTINSTYDTTKIKSVTVNVSGGGSPTLQTKSVSYTPSESQQTAQVTADEGYDALQEVDVTVGAVSSTYVGSGIDRNDSTDLTASGATVTAPAGYYEESASKAVAAGTAGTPSATKGEVSNHSIEVTPSVTNSAGYIASETKTGTAVTVSASELVSGTKSITANGTGIDVTDYAAVDVAVSGGGDTVIETVVISSATSSICFNDVLQTLEDANYTLTYKDCLLVFRASGTAVPTILPSNYTYNNQQILVKDWLVWNVNYNRCNYQSGAKTPDSCNPFMNNNALQNSGNVVDANHKIDNTYASAFQAIGGVGTKVVMFEIPIDWSVFFST